MNIGKLKTLADEAAQQFSGLESLMTDLTNAQTSASWIDDGPEPEEVEEWGVDLLSIARDIEGAADKLADIGLAVVRESEEEDE